MTFLQDDTTVIPVAVEMLAWMAETSLEQKNKQTQNALLHQLLKLSQYRGSSALDIQYDISGLRTARNELLRCEALT